VRAWHLLVLAGLLAACDDGSAAAPTAAPATWAPTGDAAQVSPKLCSTVRAWADASVEAVNGFRLASPTLDPDGRRTRYAEAFREQVALDERLATALDELALPAPVQARLDTAVADVETTVDDSAAEAAALPDSAYRFPAVSEGTLLTGTEKAKAIVFQALSELAGDPSTGILRGCGRRAALDISPPATFPD
jgi:hypothetical protein